MWLHWHGWWRDCSAHGGDPIVPHHHHPHQMQTLVLLYIMLIINEQSHHHATGFEITTSFCVLGKRLLLQQSHTHTSSRANDGITIMPLHV